MGDKYSEINYFRWLKFSLFSKNKILWKKIKLRNSKSTHNTLLGTHLCYHLNFGVQLIHEINENYVQ